MNWNQAIQDYSHYLNIERGLSSNTIDSYVLDVNKLILLPICILLKLESQAKGAIPIPTRPELSIRKRSKLFV